MARHEGEAPLFGEGATTSASAAVRAIGFSTKTCLPASRAWRASLRAS